MECMKYKWNFIIAAAMQLVICVSCVYANKKQPDRETSNPTDTIRNYRADGIAAKDEASRMNDSSGMYPVNLDDRPSVIQLFSAVLPLVDNDVVKDAAKLIIEGRQPYPEGGATKTVDLKSGYISYQGGGAPPSGMEACIWRCTDRTTLLAINVLGESPDVQPTIWFGLFRYYPDKKSLRLLERQSSIILMPDANHPVHITLPRKGKDLEYINLNENFEAVSTQVLPWKGTGFLPSTM